MSYCNCPCAREIDRLQDQVRELEHLLSQVRYDLEHEIDDRRSAVRMLSSDISDATWSKQP